MEKKEDKKYRNPALCVDAVAIQNGKVLLIKRGIPPFEGKWALSGGHVEYGETTEAAVLREFFEETGLSAKVGKLVGVYSAPDRDPRGHKVSVTYTLSDVMGEPKGGDDAKEVKWWRIDDLPRLAFDHEQILKDGISVYKDSRNR